jgi:xanthine dehydrogenase large subunit
MTGPVGTSAGRTTSIWRPGGAGDAGRGWRRPRLVLDPASDRGAASLVAACWLSPSHAITVEVRRMGGGFGGKETQPTCSPPPPPWWRHEDRPAGQDPARPRRRHDHDRQAARFRDRLRGRLRRRRADDRASRWSWPRAAACPPTSRADQRPRDVPRRQRLLPAGRRDRLAPLRKTHTVSNTAFRGFGGPQGMMAIERVMDEIAYRARPRSAGGAQAQFLRRRPRRDALSPDGRRQYRRPNSSRSWSASCDYQARRAAIAAFNAAARCSSAASR